MDENHWFQIGFLFCAGFGAGWVLRSQRPGGTRIGSALVLTSLAIMQVPELVTVGSAQRRIFLWAAIGVAVVAAVVMSVMGRGHRTTAV